MLTSAQETLVKKLKNNMNNEGNI